MPIAKISATALVVHSRVSRDRKTRFARIARHAAFWAQWTTLTHVTTTASVRKSMATAPARMAIAQPACQECTRIRVMQTAVAEATTAAATQTARRRPIGNHVHPARRARRVSHVRPVKCVHLVSRDHPVKHGHRARLHSMRTAHRSSAHPMTGARVTVIAAAGARAQKVAAPPTRPRPHRPAAMLNSAGAQTP